MSEFSRKFYLFLLLVFFLLLMGLLTYWFFDILFDFSFKNICYESLYQRKSYWPFWNNTLLPLSNYLMYALSLFLCFWGIRRGLEKFKTVELKSLLFLSIAALIIIGLFNTHYLIRLISLSCPS